jgi:hypothetical protein
MSKDFASESGHWYCAKTGEPRYTMTGKNGKERATTIRDARKDYALVPSVTTICGILAKPALVKWAQTQVLHASLTLPRIEGETEDAFAERVIADSEAQSRKAREAGTKLHGEIEAYLSGAKGDCDLDKDTLKTILSIAVHCLRVDVDLGQGKSEKSFAHALGFGGKVDWHNDSTVVDFKTKDKIEDGKRLAWDEHVIQLAAYALGLGIVAPRCINVFVGVSDGKVVLHEWEPIAIAKGERMFRLLLELWQTKNDWHPNETVADAITRQTGGQL